MTAATPGTPDATPTDGLLPPWRRSARPYLLVLPAVALTIGILYPFVQGAIYAFQNYKATRPNPEFIGFRNFVSITAIRADGPICMLCLAVAGAAFNCQNDRDQKRHRLPLKAHGIFSIAFWLSCVP